VGSFLQFVLLRVGGLGGKGWPTGGEFFEPWSTTGGVYQRGVNEDWRPHEYPDISDFILEQWSS